MKHLHSWKKYKDDTYYCTGLTCYMKLKIDFLYGKLAECHLCHREFVIMPGKFDSESLWINCPDCKDKENPLTVDGVKRSITLLIRDQVKEAIHLKLLNINRRARELQSKENSLIKREQQLNSWEKRLETKSAKDLEELTKKRKNLADFYRRRKEKFLTKVKDKKVLKNVVDVGDLILKGIDNERLGSSTEKL